MNFTECKKVILWCNPCLAFVSMFFLRHSNHVANCNINVPVFCLAPLSKNMGYSAIRVLYIKRPIRSFHVHGSGSPLTPWVLIRRFLRMFHTVSREQARTAAAAPRGSAKRIPSRPLLPHSVASRRRGCCLSFLAPCRTLCGR